MLLFYSNKECFLLIHFQTKVFYIDVEHSPFWQKFLREMRAKTKIPPAHVALHFDQLSPFHLVSGKAIIPGDETGE